MPGLYPNPSAAPEAFQPGDQVRWYVGDAHISPYVGVVVHIHPGIQKVDVDFPVGGVQRMSPEDLILVTRFTGETTSAPQGGDYRSYDKTVSDKAYGTMSQNLREMSSRVVSKKASQGQPMARAIAERFASEVVDSLAADVVECLSKGLKDVEAYQTVYPKYASKCSDAFLRGAVRRVYAAAAGGNDDWFKNAVEIVQTMKDMDFPSGKVDIKNDSGSGYGFKRDLRKVSFYHHPSKGLGFSMHFDSSNKPKEATVGFLWDNKPVSGPYSELTDNGVLLAGLLGAVCHDKTWESVEKYLEDQLSGYGSYRSRDATNKPGKWTTSNTEFDTWSERDRASVILKDKASDNSIMEWWDEAVGEAIEDGFLSRDKRKWHQDAVDYANEHGLKPMPNSYWHKAFQDKDAGNVGLPLPQNYDTFEKYLESLKAWLGVDKVDAGRVSEEKRRFEKSKAGK